METTRGSASTARRLPETLSCRNPATLEKLGDVPVFSRDAVVERVEARPPRAASWGQTSFAERRRVLRRCSITSSRTRRRSAASARATRARRWSTP